MISIVYCTRKSDHKYVSHIRKTSGINKGLEIIEIVNNGESLTKCYNRGLKQATNNIVVFCHDDLIFNKDGWGKKLVNLFETSDYGILGIAGTTNLHESGRWWTDSSKMVGIVKHSHNGKTWESKYSGNFPKEILETVTVDGLFFAIHKGRIKENFNEDVKGFHFYEIDFCFRNKLAGVKVGVVFDIKVTHKSIGETNQEWEENRELFVSKFKDKLPFNIEVKPKIEQLDVQLIETPKVKVLISTSGDKKKLTQLCSRLTELNYTNYSVDVVVNQEHEKEYSSLKIDGVTFHDGVYNTINKNLSVLKWDTDFISEKDELILFISDNIIIENDIISKFVKLYSSGKKTFGAVFPRTLNEDNTILACGVDNIIIEKDGKTSARYNFKGSNSYHNFNVGLHEENFGNVGLCFMTTYKNLEECGWFRLDLEKMFYETAFSLTCSLNKKRVFVDNDCVVRLTDKFINSEADILKLNEDYNKFLTIFNESNKYHKFLKVTKQG
jgi:hypothetical protein